MRVLIAAALGFSVAFLLGFTTTVPARHSTPFSTTVGNVYVHDPYVSNLFGNVTGKVPPSGTTCTASQALGLYDDGGSLGLNCLDISAGGTPGGNTTEVQYNNAGAFGGIANFESDGTRPSVVAETSHPSAPGSNSLAYDYRPQASWPQTPFRIESFMGLPRPAAHTIWSPGSFAAISTTATWLSECHIWGIWASSGAGTAIQIGSGTSIQATGSSNQLAWANTTWKTRQRLQGFTSAATSNSTAGVRLNTFTTWRGNAAGAGGFAIWQRAYIASAAGGQQFFAGLAGQTGLFTAGNNPSTILDTVYFGCDQSQSTLRVMSNDNSGSATETADLGANFPCTTNGAGYDFWFAAKPNDTAISYFIERLDSSFTASGTITTDLPRNTVQLAAHVYINNGSDGGTTAARIDWGGLCMLNNW